MLGRFFFYKTEPCLLFVAAERVAPFSIQPIQARWQLKIGRVDQNSVFPLQVALYADLGRSSRKCGSGATCLVGRVQASSPLGVHITIKKAQERLKAIGGQAPPGIDEGSAPCRAAVLMQALRRSCR
jgi:hypothetical protein